jgi:hypothetical protein
MTHAERDEVYKAGREGRTVTHTPYADAYQQGQRDRKREKSRRDEGASGGGEAIIAIVLLGAIAAIIGIAIVASVAALAAAVVLLLASRLPFRSGTLSYREAYKACFYVMVTWLVATGAVGFGAYAAQTGQPGAPHELVRAVAAAFEMYGGLALAVPISLVPWPEGVNPPQPVFSHDVDLTAVLILTIPAWLAAAIALRVNTDQGWLSALITTPVLIVVGVVFGLVVVLACGVLAVRADTAPLVLGPELAYTTLLAGVVVSGAAIIGSVAGGTLVAVVAAILALGRRFPLAVAMRGTGLAVFTSCVVTALALFLFRNADPLVAAVRAAVTARQMVLPPWSVLEVLLPLAVPGLLLGALFIRRVMPGAGAPRYLLACAIFAPIGLLFDVAALAAGLAAFDSEYFSAFRG